MLTVGKLVSPSLLSPSTTTLAKIKSLVFTVLDLIKPSDYQNTWSRATISRISWVSCHLFKPAKNT